MRGEAGEMKVMMVIMMKMMVVVVTPMYIFTRWQALF